ncbi:hypothetical protein HanXRQr2_Chr07g0282211 [Helianthus annuus]|uniref:Uncharacterized protein n=1 Tax=Helianthus annuus TaxID=4232 RepID=A0A9K3NF62_HELAN|nr:hypothetical protein HanXRQr2_Chr07g0282211 [Helianthus annuus]KAJ0555617.1 hypothetical protein HanIR_Chr07g0304131 [Helianthus annuus]
MAPTLAGLKKLIFCTTYYSKALVVVSPLNAPEYSQKSCSWIEADY